MRPNSSTKSRLWYLCFFRQFIYEFHYLKTLTPDDLTMIRLLSRIKEMYWLDGGHGGAKNTWITSRSLLETLTRLNINIHVHVTPYQVQDERRPWIRKEEKTFTDLLRRLGAPLTRCLHFDTSVANLFTHFEVLQVFRQPCPQQPPVHINPQKDGDDEKWQKFKRKLVSVYWGWGCGRCADSVGVRERNGWKWIKTFWLCL